MASNGAGFLLFVLLVGWVFLNSPGESLVTISHREDGKKQQPVAVCCGHIVASLP